MSARNGLDLWITYVKFPFGDSGEGSAIIRRADVESDIRFYRRRASEELSAANRAVTESARERRMMMAGIFLERLKALDANRGAVDSLAAGDASAFHWSDGVQVD